MKNLLWIGVFIFILHGCNSHQYKKVFTVKATDYAFKDTPLYVDLDSELFEGVESICLTSKSRCIPAQKEVISEETVRIWWTATQEKGESVNYGLILNKSCDTGQFSWEKVSAHSTRLKYDEQPVIQYEHPAFDPDNFWRGPIWGATNRLAIDALDRRGFDDAAARLRRETLSLMLESDGFLEIYHPFSGKGSRSTMISGFGAGVFLDLYQAECAS